MHSRLDLELYVKRLSAYLFPLELKLTIINTTNNDKQNSVHLFKPQGLVKVYRVIHIGKSGQSEWKIQDIQLHK